MKIRLPKLEVVAPDHEAREMLKEIQADYHEELRIDDIELLWHLGARMSKGRRVLGTCKVAGEELYRLAGVNVVITLDRAWWDSVPPSGEKSKCYLIDHELSHATPIMMEVEVIQDGQVVGLDLVHAFDAGEPRRYLYRSVGHDLEDFAGPIARWGVQPDLERFLESAQLALPGFGNQAEERPRLRAVS